MDTNTFNNKTNCYLLDKYSGNDEYEEYTGPVYTKFNGMYGYLCVSVFDIYFFWHTEDDIHFDDISNRFHVKYITNN
jgi:hypothetical protein